LAKNYGIEYSPNIFYKLDEAPPNQYKKRIIKSENYVSSKDNEEKVEELNVKIDFLIDKTEKELAKEDGFEDYRPKAVKKYYCQQILSDEDNSYVTEFEGRQSDITGNMAIDYYKRLLSLKRENENDLDAILDLMKFEAKGLVNYIKDLAYEFDLEEDYLDIIYRQDVIDDSKKKIEILNDIFLELERKRENLKEEFKKESRRGNADKARSIQFEMDRVRKEISRTKNSLGYTASHSYSIYKKLEKTDSFVQKIGYMVIASPYDNFDGTVCCMLKALLKQAGLDDDIEDIDDRLERLNIKELKDAVDTIRALLALSYNDASKILAQIENELIDILTAPLKALLGKSISMLRDLEISAFRNVYKLFDSVSGDFDNPDNILDCIYLEELMDFTFDKMDEVFEEIEECLLDIYRAIHQQIDIYDEDSVKLFEKAKTQAVYDLLTKFSKVLNTLDKFSLSQGIEQWIEGFLVDSGFGTYYDNESGTYKNVNVGGCISPFDYDGSYNNFIPEYPSDIPRIEFANNQEYKKWIKDDKAVSFSCELNTDAKNEENKNLLEKLKKDIDIADKDVPILAANYIENKDLNY